DNLQAFRKWAESDAFPEEGCICYLAGEVWVDMSKEQFFSHNQLKNTFNIRVGGMVLSERLGRYVPDGMLLTNDLADLASRPDGAYVSRESFLRKRVELVKGKRGGYVELIGTPDMVLEILSDSSEEKDTVTLRKLYWQAGI